MSENLKVFQSAYAPSEMDCARAGCARTISQNQLFVGDFDFSLFGNAGSLAWTRDGTGNDKPGKCKGAYW